MLIGVVCVVLFTAAVLIVHWTSERERKRRRAREYVWLWGDHDANP